MSIELLGRVNDNDDAHDITEEMIIHTRSMIVVIISYDVLIVPRYVELRIRSNRVGSIPCKEICRSGSRKSEGRNLLHE